MPPKNTENKNALKDFEKRISPIMVVNNSSLKPYVELFEYAPENIYQQPLGTLIGFFEIKEYSEESAYIVNFLTSVLKKEYYINPKRPVEDSLDSALHKINLALSELAKQGNVEWLGKLNAAICVLEKNNAHFSVSGNAKIFLYRKQILTDISDGLAQDEVEPHPLKTFVNVSSGRLEKNDRLLITAEDIFHILSESDLKKNFQRFEGAKFVQFLKTALSNQLEMIAAVVVELKDATEKKAVKTLATETTEIVEEQTTNVFSQQAFTKENPITVEETMALAEALEQEGEELEYIDKKTGHIYIQGETDEIPEASPMLIYWDIAKTKAAEGWFVAKNDLRRRYVLFKKQVAKKMEQRRLEKEKLAELAEQEAQKQAELRTQQEALEFEQLKLEQQRAQELAEQARLAELEEKKNQRHLEIEIQETETALSKPLSFQEKLKLAQAQQKREPVIDLRAKTKIESLQTAAEPAKTKSDTIEEFSGRAAQIAQTVEITLTKPESKLVYLVRITKQSSLPLLAKATTWSKEFFLKSKTQLQSYRSKINTEPIEHSGKTEHHYTPRFNTISKSFARFTPKQKYYTWGALVLVFVVPFFIARYLNRPKPHPITELQALPPSPSELLAADKNINLSPKAEVVLAKQNLITTLITNSGTLAITKSSVITLDNQKDFPLPAEAGTAVKAAYMNDLSLALIVTDKNKVLSFSPTSLKFIDNNINFTSDPSNVQLGTYLTYLYVLDSESNQIYRFPRAEGGFGEKTSWYKDTAPLSNISDLTMDENIYVAQGGKVLKLFKGQSQNFSLEQSKTPIQVSKLYTNLDSTSLWALDTQNSRLIEYSKNGNILAQYYSENLKNGTSLSVDEKTKTAYVTTSSDLISVTLQ